MSEDIKLGDVVTITIIGKVEHIAEVGCIVNAHGVDIPVLKSQIGEWVDPDTAIIAFAGWLTSREEVSGPFSSHHNAGDMVQLIRQFCEAQGWEAASDERFQQQCKTLRERYPE